MIRFCSARCNGDILLPLVLGHTIASHIYVIIIVVTEERSYISWLFIVSHFLAFSLFFV